MLPHATPAIHATVDPYEQTERDTLRIAARRRLSSPAAVGARIALALCEVEAGMRSPLQLERLCHLTLRPKLSVRLQRGGGPVVTAGSLVRVIAQEHTPGWPRSPCWCAAAGGRWRWRDGWMAPRATGSWSSSSGDPPSAWRGTSSSRPTPGPRSPPRPGHL